MYLTANKSDKKDDVQVPFEEGISFAKNNNFAHFSETSAKSGKGIRDLFFRIGKQLYIQSKNEAPNDRDTGKGYNISLIDNHSSILLRDRSASNGLGYQARSPKNPSVRKIEVKKPKKKQ